MSLRFSAASGAIAAASSLAVLVVLAAPGAEANQGKAGAKASQTSEIAFVRSSSEIYVVRADGHGVRKVARFIFSTPVLNPGWSSDRKRIAFMEFIKESDTEIGVVGSNGKNRRDDPFALSGSYPIADEPAWSPDDKRIAFEAFATDPMSDAAAIVVASTLGPNRPLTRMLTDFRHRDLAPTWSPSGSQICFERNTKRGAGFYEIGIAKNSALFVISSKGGRPRRITSGGEPDWSPDAKLIAFARLGDIYVVRPNGLGRRLLIGGRTSDGEPRWSPDGTKIAFVRPRRATCSSVRCVHDLWVADSSGRNQRLVVRNAQLIDW
jgi:Tol biopolymer transport system component